MKPRNREINIFNLSMLDVISGAMAAFLIIMVILMPYYKKESIDYQAIIADLQARVEALTTALASSDDAAAQARAEAERAREQAAAAAAEAESARQQAAQAQQQAAQAQQQAARAQQEADAQRSRADGLAEKLAQTFLVLYIRWDTGDDVDLHLIDPAGGEFYFSNKTIAGHPGELSEDNINGPGNEVWEIRNAPPGEYKVYVELYAVKDRRKPVVVKGRVFHCDGSQAFNETRLTRSKQKELMAVITVDDDGHVSVR